MNKVRRKHAFTLVEMAIAAALLVTVLAIAMRGFMHVLSGASQNRVQNQLDMDVQTSIERIKMDLRLTSLTQTYVSPSAGAKHEAISFPLARDDDGDGMVDLDEDGEIIWDKTMVYHVWDGTPNELRLTIFDPRDNELSEDERQAQLDHVFSTGSGQGTYNGHSARTIVIFKNLFDWNVSPSAPLYDGYAATTERDEDVNLGSVILDPGKHTITFLLTDKNAASASYGLGIDYLFGTPSYSIREAETLPIVSQFGGAARVNFMDHGSWSANYELDFPSSQKGSSLTLEIENDAWEETNFDSAGQRKERTTVSFDSSISPADFVFSLRGMETNWLAAEQTYDFVGKALPNGHLVNTAVRVMIAGNEVLNGGWIHTGGAKAKVDFRAGPYPNGGLVVWYANIAEAASATNDTMDILASTLVPLSFGGNFYCIIPGGGHAWSDFANLTIEEDKNYIVSFITTALAGWGNAWFWEDSVPTNSPRCFVIPPSSSPKYTDIAAPTWSTRSDVTKIKGILGVQAMYVSYPTNGLFTSAIFDTTMESPVYSRMDWHSIVPSGCTLRMKVRAGSTNDLSDATDWDSISPMATSGSISPGSERYIQFQAELRPDATFMTTPKVRDVRINWPGEKRAVDVGGTFTKAPNHGIFEVSVDGRPLQAAIRVELEIFAEARGFGGVRKLTSSLKTEVQPLNTWR